MKTLSRFLLLLLNVAVLSAVSSQAWSALPDPPSAAPAMPSVVLNIGPSGPVAGNPLMLAARVVAPQSASPIPTGTVTFSAAGLVVGTASLDSTGLARLTNSTLSPGTFAFSAAYHGDGNYQPAVSPQVGVMLRQAPNAPADPLAIFPPAYGGAAGGVHDPAIIRHGDRYYVLSTDVGNPSHEYLLIRCSQDRVHWANCGHVFDSIPDWVKQAVPGVLSLWAPEIVFMNHQYYLYYSGSTFGSNRSVIGLATNATLDPNDPAYRWVDRGEVIRSIPSNDFNAIDPSVLVDSDGSVWMTLGSFWSGIRERRLDPLTGMPSALDTNLYYVASRAVNAFNPIEGSSLRKHGKYYYLFVSVDFCCRGASSTYRILVGRATSPTGPFLDESGVPMQQGGGTQLLAGDAQWAGPGGLTVYIDPQRGDIISYHAYHVPDGYPWLHVDSLAWVNDWPVILSPPKMSLAHDPAAPVLGQPSNLVAMLSASASTYPVPSGRVVFFDGQEPIGSGVIDDHGIGRLSVALSPGPHEITARYSGDNVYEATESTTSLSVSAVSAVVLSGNRYDFGGDFLTHTLVRPVVTVFNYQATPLAFNPSVTGSSSFSISDVCGHRIPAYGSCAITVGFTPATVGPQNAILNLGLSAGASSTADSRTVVLTGSGIQTPEVLLSRTSFDFGEDLLDNPLVRSVVEVRNNQTTSLRFSPYVTRDRSFSIASSCGSQIPPFGVCSLDVTFSPGISGAHSGDLNFNWANAPQGTPTYLPLAGVGITRGKVVLSGSHYDFKSDLIHHPLVRPVVEVFNDQATAISLHPTIKGSRAFSLTGVCENPIPAFGTCTLEVSFTPSSAQEYEAVLDLNLRGAPRETSDTVRLEGRGITVPKVVVSNDAFHFGRDVIDIPITRPVTTIQNYQTTEITLNPVIGGDGSFALTSSAPSSSAPSSLASGSAASNGPCGNTIPAFGSCSVFVNFDPATEGIHQATLDLNFGGAPERTSDMVKLTGKGSLPPESGKYINPLQLNDPTTGPVISCPDPAILKQQESGRNTWYLYCTGDAHNFNDIDQFGNLKEHVISIYRSVDLIHWKFVGDAISQRPNWIDPFAGIWAPAIAHFNNHYYLYFTAQNTKIGGSAIGVAVSDSPSGPFIDKGSPILEPQGNGFRWVFDPETIEDDAGQRYILYGSYVGGISMRTLSPDGLTADPATDRPIAIDNRYEGANIVKRNGYFYLFVSAGNCCAGPLSGYNVWVGRAQAVSGPYLDKLGLPLLDSRPGGTPVLSMNGNQFVGPGGNVVFADESGQDYILYHAVDSTNWYFPGGLGNTARPVMLDALDWVDGWPVARGGRGPSDAESPQPLPAAQPGESNEHQLSLQTDDRPGELLPAFSDEFNGAVLSPQWSFLHLTPPFWVLTGNEYEVATVGPDMTNLPMQVPLLAEPTPPGEFMVEAKVRINFPIAGCCFTFPQVELMIYGDDQNFLKADVFGDWDTRQVEFVKVTTAVPPAPTFGSSPLGATRDSTWLRIVKRIVDNQELYTAYSSIDGVVWIRGGTWTHRLGSSAKIALGASTGLGFISDVDYVRLYSLPACTSCH